MLFDYWYVFVAFIAIIAAIVLFFCKFHNLPTEEQIISVKEWLKYAVSMAEKELGSGTGQLKLRQVYDMFIMKFPKLSMMIPFGLFSSWVDESLEWLKTQLACNRNIKDLVEKNE